MTLGPCVSILDTMTAATGLRLAGSSHPEEAAPRAAIDLPDSFMYDLEQIRSALRSALPDRGSDESS
jgi:hypothetical protein